MAAKESAFSRLKPQHQLFVLEYFKQFNATKAAIAAGYSQNNPSERGSEVLRIPTIAEAIHEQMDILGVTEDRIKSEISELAYGQDAAEFEGNINEGTTLKDLRRAGVNTKFVKAISKSDTKEGCNRKIELHDRLRALELLGKVRAMFTDKVENSGDVRLTVQHIGGQEPVVEEPKP